MGVGVDDVRPGTLTTYPRGGKEPVRLPPYFFTVNRPTSIKEVARETAGKGSYAAQPGARWLRHHIVRCDGLSRIFYIALFFVVVATGIPSSTHAAVQKLVDGGGGGGGGGGDGGGGETAPPPDAFQESGGQVVMEAENHDAKITRNSKSWNLLATLTGYSGTGYLQALPNSGTLIDTGYATSSPELQYRINFTTTGTYYVWIRGRGPTTSDDSIHGGIDGSAPSSAARISGFPNSWTWSRSISGGVATIVVSTGGIHTFNLWMREDGFIIDKILLRTNSSSTAPSGTGPAESPRSGTTNAAPIISSISPPTGSKYYEQDAVTISVSASDPDGDSLEYQFSVDGVVKRVWGATSTYALTTTDRNYGKRTISVSVRDGRSGEVSAATVIFFYKRPLQP